MKNNVDPKKCPICGESNQCQNHHLNKKSVNTCWCFTEKFSDKSYNYIRLHGGKNPSCICCDCLKKAS